MCSEQSQVLVVGAGLVGLSAAALLAWHGVEVTLVERRSGISAHPRARGLNPRTMEVFRQLGVERAIRNCPSALALIHNSGIIAVESLAGRPLGVLTQPYYAGDNGTSFEELSPTRWCLCHQAEVEPLLRTVALELGADLRFDTELLEVCSEPGGVVADLRRSDGSRQQLRASYLIAADGAGSLLRERLGIGQHGPGTLGHFMNIEFRADLGEQLGDRRFVLCYTVSGKTRSALLPVNNSDHWLLHVPFQPGEESSFSVEACVQLVRTAAGESDLEVEIQSIAPWESAGRVADRWREGRVLLAGDAAHVMPPSGAFGVNTGIQDVHNLAWKLAAVLQGRADPALIDTYQSERLPVAEWTVEQAVLRSRDRPRLAGPGAASPPDPAIVPDQQVMFGYRYPLGASCTEAGGTAELPGEPGSRVPQRQVPGPDGPASSVDLAGRQPLLLTGLDDAGWSAAAASSGVPSRSAGPDLSTAVRIGRTGAVLLRPDGFVFRRWADVPDRPAPALVAAVEELYGHPSARFSQ